MKNVSPSRNHASIARLALAAVAALLLTLLAACVGDEEADTTPRLVGTGNM
jgi:hypothetical protein